MQATRNINACPTIHAGIWLREYVLTKMEEAIPALVSSDLPRSTYICLESLVVHRMFFVFANRYQ
jgi:hypothetical protein